VGLFLKGKLDLRFIYKLTKDCYSHTGKPSLDPVVFFKLVIVGYLENICSDRALERMVDMRIDLKYFLDYDLDERAPDHSTICKTRQRIGVEIFEAVFNHILGLCACLPKPRRRQVEAGLVSGKTQSFDTAYVNANASLDRMAEIKMIDRDPKAYLDEVLAQDEDEDDLADKRLQQSQKKLEQYQHYRKKKYTQQEGGKPHRKNKRRFLSNATHQSLTDPDARVAKKSGKPRMLCYSAFLGVDTQSNVITHAAAEHSSRKDSRLLLDGVEDTLDRLEALGLKPKEILADAGFSSGENYYILDHWKLRSYIPTHGGFKPEREGFLYDEQNDQYTCRNGKRLKYKSTGRSGGYLKKRYLSSRQDCKGCPWEKTCADKRGIKKIEHTIYREEYMEMIKRLKSKKGKRKYAERMCSVEPVFGSLQQHYGLRWMNVRGKISAEKVMLMCAAAFNLKKWVKQVLESSFFTKNGRCKPFWVPISPVFLFRKIPILIYWKTA
jgi:IS5 family transposase